MIDQIVHTFSSFQQLISSLIFIGIHEYCPRKANRIFGTVKTVLIETMKMKGNNFKIPHMKKETLERQGRLPTSIPCPPSLLDEAETTLVAL